MRWCGRPPPMATVWTLGGEAGMPNERHGACGRPTRRMAAGFGRRSRLAMGCAEPWGAEETDRWEAERSARGACRHPVDEWAGSHGAESAMRARPRAAGTCGERGQPIGWRCLAGSDGPHAMEGLTRADRPPERPETTAVRKFGARGSPSRRFLRRGGVPIPPLRHAWFVGRSVNRAQAPPYRLRVRRSSTAICAGALMLPGRSEPSSSTGCHAECSAPVLLGRRSERGRCPRRPIRLPCDPHGESLCGNSRDLRTKLSMR